MILTISSIRSKVVYSANTFHQTSPEWPVEISMLVSLWAMSTAARAI
jgi:hypothetical protein